MFLYGLLHMCKATTWDGLPLWLRLSDATETGRWSIFVDTSTNCLHLTLTLRCTDTSLRGSRMTSAATGVISLRLSMTVFEVWLMNSGAFTTSCNVRSTKLFKAADTLSFPAFWVALNSYSTNMLNASSTCTGMAATTSRTKSCPLVQNAARWLSYSLVFSLSRSDQRLRRKIRCFLVHLCL